MQMLLLCQIKILIRFILNPYVNYSLQFSESEYQDLRKLNRNKVEDSV